MTKRLIGLPGLLDAVDQERRRREVRTLGGPAGAVAARLLSRGGSCCVEPTTQERLYDIELEDGRRFEGCVPLGRCVPGELPGPLLVVRATGEFSIVVGSRVASATPVGLTGAPTPESIEP